MCSGYERYRKKLFLLLLILTSTKINSVYSQLSPRRTPLGPALSVRLREMSVLERCPSYEESNKGNKQRQEPAQGVCFTEVSVKRESTVVIHNRHKM